MPTLAVRIDQKLHFDIHLATARQPAQQRQQRHQGMTTALDPRPSAKGLPLLHRMQRAHRRRQLRKGILAQYLRK